MDKIRANRINLDTLFEHKKTVDMITVTSYNTVLERIHTKIQVASRQRNTTHSCWFVVPEILIGTPRYDVKACTAYLINELEKNGFVVKYTHPNLLFISWAHWVPDYVRQEYKQQTGIVIDGFGKEVKKDAPPVKLVEKVTTKPVFMPTGKFAYDQEMINSMTNM